MRHFFCFSCFFWSCFYSLWTIAGILLSPDVFISETGACLESCRCCKTRGDCSIHGLLWDGTGEYAAGEVFISIFYRCSLRYCNGVFPVCACRFEQTLRGSVHEGEKYGKNPGCRKSIIQKFKIIEIAFPLKPIYNKSRKYLWRYLPWTIH